MKVLELRGLKSLRAYNAWNVLLLGLKMLPAYMGEDYESFVARVQSMPLEDKRKIWTEAAQFVDLEPEEVQALLAFCADVNGVPYGPSNIANLTPPEIVQCIVAVCLEIGELKLTLITEEEKKKSVTSQ